MQLQLKAHYNNSLEHKLMLNALVYDLVKQEKGVSHIITL